MQHDPSNYRLRQGVRPVSWQDFHGICKALAAATALYQPHIIMPIGRGGYYPGTLIAHLLQAEIYPVRVSRRVGDVVKYPAPRWLLEPTTLVAGKRVLVVDEICSSGETLNMVVTRVAALGASAVRSAVLYAHTAGVQIPDYVGWVTDALLLNPWDREVLVNGNFVFAPEYVQALGHQGVVADHSLLIPATPVALARGGGGDSIADPESGLS
jgi:hypoxanthine phosphoribosyltransferase